MYACHVDGLQMEDVKVVIVGDGVVGKSCLIHAWLHDSFPELVLHGTVFDEYEAGVLIDRKLVHVSLFDTSGMEHFDRLRTLFYPDTDVVIVCFSVAFYNSLDNVWHKWIPEVKHFCPRTPIVLAGTQADRRGSVTSREREVSVREAERMAKKIGAVGYYETSALTVTNVNTTIMAAIRAGIGGDKKNSSGRSRWLKWPWRRRQSASSHGLSVNGCRLPPPPDLPPNEDPPLINIPSSTLAQDLSKLVNSKNQSDVVFHLDSTPYHTHRYILASSSDVFRRVLGIESAKVKAQNCPGWSKRRSQKITPSNINAGKIEGFISVTERLDNEAGTLTEITLDSSLFTAMSFKRTLEFLYTGVVSLDKESEQLEETLKAASILNLPELMMIVENATNGSKIVNSKVLERSVCVAKELFFNKLLLSDISFRVEGTLVHAHKLVLCTRCDVMMAMLTGGFIESQCNEIEIPDISLKEFLAFLEYLYTDHAPINEGNVMDILVLSNRYVMPRLMALCELYISKEVERATAKSIAQADIDVIGLLLTAQLHNAHQLSGWCLHFISSNFVAFKDKQDFSLITGDNLDHVTSHRWPPLSYEQAMDEYRKKYLKEDNEDDDNVDSANAVNS